MTLLLSHTESHNTSCLSYRKSQHFLSVLQKVTTLPVCHTETRITQDMTLLLSHTESHNTSHLSYRKSQHLLSAIQGIALLPVCHTESQLTSHLPVHVYEPFTCTADVCPVFNIDFYHGFFCVPPSTVFALAQGFPSSVFPIAQCSF